MLRIGSNQKGNNPVNMNRLLNMVVRQVVRQVVNRGIRAGINSATSAGQSKTAPQDRKAQARTRQSAKMMRRMTRL